MGTGVTEKPHGFAEAEGEWSRQASDGSPAGDSHRLLRNCRSERSRSRQRRPGKGRPEAEEELAAISDKELEANEDPRTSEETGDISGSKPQDLMRSG